MLALDSIQASIRWKPKGKWDLVDICLHVFVLVIESAVTCLQHSLNSICDAECTEIIQYFEQTIDKDNATMTVGDTTLRTLENRRPNIFHIVQETSVSAPKNFSIGSFISLFEGSASK